MLLLRLLSCPSHPGHCHPGPLVCCGPVSWGLFLLQPLQSGCLGGSKGYSSGLLCSEQPDPGWEKKTAPPCSPVYRAWGSCYFLQRRNQDKGSPPPPLDPTQDNSIVRSQTPPGSQVSPTLPCRCNYQALPTSDRCPCWAGSLTLPTWARFGESSQFILSTVGWLVRGQTPCDRQTYSSCLSLHF